MGMHTTTNGGLSSKHSKISLEICICIGNVVDIVVVAVAMHLQLIDI